MTEREKISFRALNRIAMRVQEAHMGGKFRPVAVAVMRRDADGAILFVQSARSADDWAFPQGGIGASEPPVVALVREVNEELGIGPEAYSLDWYLGEADLPYEPDRARKRDFIDGKRYFFFALTCQRPDGIVLAPAELSALRWAQDRDAGDVMTTTRPEKRDMLLGMLRRLTL